MLCTYIFAELNTLQTLAVIRHNTFMCFSVPNYRIILPTTCAYYLVQIHTFPLQYQNSSYKHTTIARQSARKVLVDITCLNMSTAPRLPIGLPAADFSSPPFSASSRRALSSSAPSFFHAPPAKEKSHLRFMASIRRCHSRIWAWWMGGATWTDSGDAECEAPPDDAPRWRTWRPTTRRQRAGIERGCSGDMTLAV